MRIKDEKLSKNFSLYECLYDQNAEEDEMLWSKQYNPTKEAVENLRYLATNTLQPIREMMGVSIRVSSGYRCPELNAHPNIRGSMTSVHILGQATDISVLSGFITSPATLSIREEIQSRAIAITGKPFRPDVNGNFYLFSWICLNLSDLDIDQVIHEKGRPGAPLWVHVASARNKNDFRQIKVIPTNGVGHILTLKEALELGC